MHRHSQRVLIIVSRFPPVHDGVTALRALKFSKYLPESNWSPVVLAPSGRQDPNRSILEPVPPNVTVVHAPRVPTPSLIARKLRPRADTAGQSTPDPSPMPRRTLGAFIRRFLILFDTPDDLVGWVPAAVFRGLWELKDRGLEVILASSPPFSTSVAAWLISRISGVPLVVDMRDVWTLDASDPFGSLGGNFRSPPSPIRLKAIRRMESSILRHASAILFTSPVSLEAYAQSFPEVADRMELILNGADSADFSPHPTPFAVPTIVHVGAVHEYQRQQAGQLVSAFGSAVRMARLPAQARVVFVGEIGEPIRAFLSRAANDAGVPERIIFLGNRSHREAVDWMQRSHALVLFDGNNPFIRLTKLSEYVVAQKPIVAFASPGGATGRETISYGGRVLDGQQPEAAINAMEWALEGWMAHDTGPIQPIPPPIDRRENARELAKILDDLSDHPNTRP